ncbi:MAG: hypothetical protein GY711_00020, partial [bacterium]|nr:hypothetical protein [bacterium]
ASFGAWVAGQVARPVVPAAIRDNVVARLEFLGVAEVDYLGSLVAEEFHDIWQIPVGDVPVVPSPVETVFAKAIAREARLVAPCAVVPPPQVPPPPVAPAAFDSLHIVGNIEKSLTKLAELTVGRLQSNTVDDRDPEDFAPREGAPSIDYRSALSRAHAAWVPVDWLPPDPCRVAQLKSQARERRRTRPETPSLAASTVEAWPPGWVGARLSFSERKTVLASRQSNVETLAPFLGNVLTFLMSHVVIGELPVDAALAHLGVLIRIADELTVARSVEYFNRLHSALLAEIRGGQVFDLAERLSVIDEGVFNRMLVEKPRHRSRSPPRPPKSRVSRAAPAEKGVDRNPVGHGAPLASGKGARKGRIPLCLDHDVAAGRRCPLGAACDKEHVDTSDPSGAERFAKAKLALDRAVAARVARGSASKASTAAPASAQSNQ